MKKNIANIVRHAEVSEKAIEKYLGKRMAGVGGLCLKYCNPNQTGYPDRICIFPNGLHVWVELKSKGKKPTALQVLRIKQLQACNALAYVADSKSGVDSMIEELQNRER